MTVEVVVTGLGTVGPHGAGEEALAAALHEGRSALTEVDRSRGFHSADSARLAGLVDPAALRPWLDPMKARRLSRPSRLAVVAARLAIEDAGLERAELAGGDVAVCLGTAFGPTGFTVDMLDQIADTGPESASPFLFMESVANAHAGQVALDSKLRGPNATVVQREASAFLAVAQGLSYLRSGRCDMALVGGVDEIAPIAHAVLDRYGALSRGGPLGECGRAFDAERDGFVAAEGASILVLERADAARARGARVRARLRTAVRANDPTASATSWGAGHDRLADVLRLGLKRAGLGPDGIDRVVSGASGSRAGDRFEALHLRALFDGSELPPVLAPKATTGEFGGSSLAAAVLAVGELDFGPTPGFECVDPELGIRPHDGRELAPARCALASNLAAGGAASWLVLERA